jgi:methionine-rich copper-binding protein CopC
MEWLARIILTIAAAILGGAAQAEAHAFLDHTLPAVGASVAAAPTEVQLWFTEPLEPAFSSVEVVGPAGERVDQGAPRVEGGNATRLSVGLKQLAPGRYRVIWRVLSIDSHVTNGDFSFTVGR